MKLLFSRYSLRSVCALALGLFLTSLPLAILAQDLYPSWWSNYGVTPQPPPGPGDSGYNSTIYSNWLTANNYQVNYAPVNLGQLKNFAVQAQSYLDAQLASIGGAGPVIDNLVSSFSTDPTTNYAPVNLGQLKAVTQPFYDRLANGFAYNGSNFTGVGFDPKPGINLHLSGNANATNWTLNQPWPLPPPAPGSTGYNATAYTNWVASAQNYAPVNLGQLKLAFSFDLGNFTPSANLSIAGDGIPDWWKVLNGLDPFGGNIATHTDFGNGRTDLQQYQYDFNLFNSTAGNLSGNLASFSSSYTTSSTSFPAIPANFTTSGLTFPRQPVSPYVFIDLGNGTVLDVNSEGDALVETGTFEDYLGNPYPTEAIWHDGNLTPLDNTDADGNPLIWTEVANDGTALGYNYNDDYGFKDVIACAPGGSGNYDTVDYLLGNETTGYSYEPAGLNAFLAFNHEGHIFFEATYTVGDGEGGSDGYGQILDWGPDGNVSTVGDAFLLAGGEGSPGVFGNVTVGQLSTNGTVTDTLQYRLQPTYDDFGALISLGNFYLNNTEVPDYVVSTSGSAGIVPEGHAYDYEVQMGNLTHAFLTATPSASETLAVLSGGGFGAANLTSSGTMLTLTQVTPSGLGVSNTGKFIQNGVVAALSDILPDAALNPDLSLNTSGLGLNVSFSSPTLNFTTVNNDGLVGGNISDSANTSATPHAIIGIRAGMYVDNNRDGNISLDKDDLPTDEKPFYFWVNDDDASGNMTGEDIPGTGSDGTGTSTNGSKDLVNYFPVYLNISQLIQRFSPANYTYKLSQADGAVNFVYTSLSATFNSNTSNSQAFDYLRNPSLIGVASGFGDDSVLDETDVCDQAVDDATKHHITSSGYALNPNFLANITSDPSTSWGVILVDGRTASNSSLRLDVYDSSNVSVANLTLPLKIGNIEDMYRHVNLRYGVDSVGGLQGISTDYGEASYYSHPNGPEGFPDSINIANWTIFVHGYKVSGADSSGWEAETFKELYWSHSHSKFVGVDWFGDPYDYSGEATPNYQTAVQNALTTANALAKFVNNRLPGGNKTIIGHSLGTMVVSSAMEDYGMNVDKAILVDGAIASEAFDGNLDENLGNMTLSSWVSGTGTNTTAYYDRRLWATDWWRRFNGTADARQYLTWQQRFNGQNGLTPNTTTVSKIYNFYSSTENVLATNANDPTYATVQLAWNTATGDGGRYSWVIQEKTKGNQIVVPFLVISGNVYMGWGFNINDPENISDPIWYYVSAGRVTMSPANITAAYGNLSTVLGNSTVLGSVTRSPLFVTGWGRNDPSSPGARIVDSSLSLAIPRWANDSIIDLYRDAKGSATAAAHRNEILAAAIPALSLPIGANSVSAFIPPVGADRNYNMPTKYVIPNGSSFYWPRSDPPVSGVPVWHHTDIHVVAYPYLHGFYDDLVNISNL